MMSAHDQALFLSDIAWFIKGYLAASGDEGSMGMGPEHVDALGMAIKNARENAEKEASK